MTTQRGIAASSWRARFFLLAGALALAPACGDEGADSSEFSGPRDQEQQEKEDSTEDPGGLQISGPDGTTRSCAFKGQFERAGEALDVKGSGCGYSRRSGGRRPSLRFLLDGESLEKLTFPLDDFEPEKLYTFDAPVTIWGEDTVWSATCAIEVQSNEYYEAEDAREPEESVGFAGEASCPDAFVSGTAEDLGLPVFSFAEAFPTEGMK